MAVKNGEIHAIPRLLRAASLLALAGFGDAAEAVSGTKRHACLFGIGWADVAVTKYVVISAAGTAEPPLVMQDGNKNQMYTSCVSLLSGQTVRIIVENASGKAVQESQDVAIAGDTEVAVTQLAFSGSQQAVLVEEIVHHGEFWHEFSTRVSRVIQEGRTLADGAAWMPSLLEEVKKEQSGWHVNIFIDHMTEPVIFRVADSTAPRKLVSTATPHSMQARHTGWSFPSVNGKATLIVTTGTESRDVDIGQVGFAGAVRFENGVKVQLVAADTYEGHEAVWTESEHATAEGGKSGPWKHWSDETSEWLEEGIRSISKAAESAPVDMFTYAVIGAAGALVLGVAWYCLRSGGQERDGSIPTSDVSFDCLRAPSMLPDEYVPHEIPLQSKGVETEIPLVPARTQEW